MGLVARHWFPGVFRASPGFWKVRIGSFQHRILVPVSELPLHGSVITLSLFFLFHSALRTVLILRRSHDEASQAGSEPCLSLAYLKFRTLA